VLIRIDTKSDHGTSSTTKRIGEAADVFSFIFWNWGVTPNEQTQVAGEMICPRCKAEYRDGFTSCADCHVDLVWELPKRAIEMRQTGELGEYRVAGGPGDPNEDPFCSFWKGNDPRLHVELCGVLDDAGIPHNTVHRRDHLFNLHNYFAYEVGVPFSMYEWAGKVVKEAYGVEDVTDAGVRELQWFADRLGRAIPCYRKLPESLTPREKENIPGPPSARGETDGYRATVKIWSTEVGEPSDFLVAALHENGIRCRFDSSGRRTGLYVLPEDEARAREIVREVVEGEPPE
jgi:hypothetical protein